MQPHSHHGNHGSPFCINGFCSSGLAELQQPQHPQHQQQPPQYNQQRQGLVAPIPNPQVHASNDPTFAALFQKQRQQIDQFINTQKNQMQLMLQQHQRELEKTAYKSMEIYYWQEVARKNEEIAKAEMKKKEMENFVRCLELETRELKRVAEERRANVEDLHNKLEEEKKKKRLLVENDARSHCGENEEARAEKRVRYGNNMVFCQKCKTNSSNVLFLPCRHISSCKVCEALLQVCPICGLEKKGVIEIQSLI